MEPDDRLMVRVLRSPHPGHVEIDRMGTPVGRAHQHTGTVMARASVIDGTSGDHPARRRSSSMDGRGRRRSVGTVSSLPVSVSIPHRRDSVPPCRRTPGFDPIEEARAQWSARWEPDVSDAMAAATSIMRARAGGAGRGGRGPAGPSASPSPATKAWSCSCSARRGVLPLGKMGQRLDDPPDQRHQHHRPARGAGTGRRIPHPTDGRTTLAEITDDGRRLAKRATRAVNAVAFGLGSLGRRGSPATGPDHPQSCGGASAISPTDARAGPSRRSRSQPMDNRHSQEDASSPNARIMPSWGRRQSAPPCSVKT